eukprot:COSAG03_NODE_3569_length_1944_cov_10.711698_2_plen_147_part_00
MRDSSVWSLLAFCNVCATWLATSRDNLHCRLMLPCHVKWVCGRIAVRERLPSGIAVAIGMYVTPNWTIPRVIGGFTNYAWRKIAPAHATRYMIVLASGFVLGEGVISIVTAVLQSLGIGVAACWGCPEPAVGGFCGGCYDSSGTRL